MCRPKCSAMLVLLASTSFVHSYRGPVSLPRFNRYLQPVSSDLSRYPPLVLSGDDCKEGGNEEDLCLNPKVIASFDDVIEPPPANVHHESDSDIWHSYMESLAIWAAVGLLLACVTFLIDLALCASCCCCCCCCFSRGKSKGYNPKKHEGPAYFLLFSFIVCVSIFTFWPIIESVDAKHIIVERPKSVVNLTRQLPNPVSHALLHIVGVTLPQLAIEINTTVATHIDPSILRKTHGCVTTILSTGNELVMKLNAVIIHFRKSLASLPATDVATALTKLSEAATGLRNVVPEIQADLSALDAGRAEVSTNVASVSKHLSAMSVSTSTLARLSEWGNVRLDLIRYQEHAPSLSEIDLLRAKLSTFRAVKTRSSARNFTSFLVELANKLDEMPNMHALADDILTINMSASAAVQDLQGFMDSLETLNKTIGTMPAAGALAKLIDKVETSLSAFDPKHAVVIRDALGRASEIVADFAHRATFSEIKENIHTLKDIVPCALDISIVISEVNSSLLRVPDGLDQAQTLLANFKHKISNAFDMTDVVVKRFDQINDTVSNMPNLTFYSKMVDGLDAHLASSKSVDLSDIRKSIAALDEEVFLDKFRANLVQARTLVSKIQCQEVPSEAEVRKLTNGVLGHVQSLVKEIKDAAAKIDLGCKHDFICKQLPIDQPLSHMDQQLQEIRMQVAAAPDASKIIAGLDSTKEALSLLPPVSSQKQAIDKLSESMSSLPSFTKFRRNLDSVESSLKSLPDTKPLLERFTDTMNEIRSFDSSKLDDYAQKLDALNVSLQDAPRTLLDKTGSYIDRYEQFVHGPVTTNGTLAALLTSVRRDALETALRKGGLTNAFIEISDVAGDVYKFWTGKADLPVEVNIRRQIQDVGPLIRALEDLPEPGEASSRRPSENGDIWFLSNIFDRAPWSSQKTHLQADAYSGFRDPMVIGYRENDGNIVDYPSDDYVPCLTKQCLDNTLTYYDHRSYFYLLALLPCTMVVLACLSLLCRSTCPALTLSLLSISFLPLIFLLTSLLFPIAIGISDACEAFDSIAVSTAPVVSPRLCHTLGISGSDGSTTEWDYDVETGICTFRLAAINSTLRLRPTEAIRSIVHDCTGKGTAGFASETFADFWTQVSLRVQPQTRDMFFELASEVGEWRPALQSILNDTAGKLGADVGTTVEELGGVFSCQNLHPVYSSMKEAACTELGGSIYLYTASWFLIAVATLFCGFPGGLFAYRAFGKDLASAPTERNQEGIELSVAVPVYNSVL